MFLGKLDTRTSQNFSAAPWKSKGLPSQTSRALFVPARVAIKEPPSPPSRQGGGGEAEKTNYPTEGEKCGEIRPQGILQMCKKNFWKSMSYTRMKRALPRVQSKVLTDLNDTNSNADDHSKTCPSPRKNDAA